MAFYKPVLFNGVFLISDGELNIQLSKEEPGIWSELGNYPKKNEAKELREKAEEDFRNFYNKDLESRKSNKVERDRKSVNLCIEKDERKRDNIDEIKSTIVGSLGDKNPTIKYDDVKSNREDNVINGKKDKVDKTKIGKDVHENNDIIDINEPGPASDVKENKIEAFELLASLRRDLVLTLLKKRS